MLTLDERLRGIELAAKHQDWRRGDLSWKLDPSKLQVDQQYEALPPLSTFVFEKSRKVGGSYWALCKAFEACIKNPGARVNYAVSTGKAATEIVVPLIAKVAKDAPPELRPEHRVQSGHVVFPADGPAKGAHIVLFGCDDMAQADRGRGPEAVLSIVDEAAFVPVLRYLLSDVLMPQHIHTKAKMILSSTPPREPGHEFVRVADAALAAGRYAHRTIFSPGGLMTPEEIDAYIASQADLAGMSVETFKKTSTYRREFLGQRVIDEALAICPEFTEHEARIIGDWERPAGFQYLHKFVSLDPGMDDNSGLLYAYMDFTAGGVLTIEDEDLLAQANTRVIAEAVKAKEEALAWGSARVQRIADDPHKRLCADMSDQHKLTFAPALKDHRDEAINLMRTLMSSGKVRIHRRCKNLARQLKNAVRTKPGGDMARTETDAHFDLVASAWYLTRLANSYRHVNPYPEGWDLRPGQIRAHPPPRRVNPLAEATLSGTPFGREILRRARKRR